MLLLLLKLYVFVAFKLFLLDKIISEATQSDIGIETKLNTEIKILIVN